MTERNGVEVWDSSVMEFRSFFCQHALVDPLEAEFRPTGTVGSPAFTQKDLACRFPTLLSAASFAFALASPALAQQPKRHARRDLGGSCREESEGGAARGDAGDARRGSEGGGEAPKARKSRQDDQPMGAPPGPAEGGETSRLRELENEMRRLEQTLEQLQGEIGKKVAVSCANCSP